MLRIPNRPRSQAFAVPSPSPHPWRRTTRWLALPLLLTVSCVTPALPQSKSDPQPKKPREKFRWVNPLGKKTEGIEGVEHRVFTSPSMQREVGYCVYLPPSYCTADQTARRYPVVYYLHGGRPGNETKSVHLAELMHRHISAAAVDPLIYVFVNGGPVSHYNMPDRDQAMGEDVFIKELIPHIDATFRTIAKRSGRGIEGFSQGGRGTARIMFKHPDLFSSAAPGGGGFATEKRISAENGRESATLQFVPGDNTWDLARQYSRHPVPRLQILIHVGTKGINYENNLEYMKFLESLEIPFACLLVENAPHSAKKIYEQQGLEIMRFHAKNFRQLSDAAAQGD